MECVRRIAVPLLSLLTVAQSYTYDPTTNKDPFDDVAHLVDGWLKASHTDNQPITQGMLNGPQQVPWRNEVTGTLDGWQHEFCSCLTNAYIASWYQMAPMLYLIEECSKDGGLIFRTGHLSQRHEYMLQEMMSCDVLKVFSYCLHHAVPEALPYWNSTCRAAHYTVTGCDANCNSAMPRAGGLGFLALAVALLASLFAR